MKAILARDLMTRRVLTAREDMTLQELAAFFRDHEITGAPVVDGQEKVVGVVSVVDLARVEAERPGEHWDFPGTDYYSQGRADRIEAGGLRAFSPGTQKRRVRDVMQTRVIAVGEDTEVGEIAQKMIEFHIHRVLVIEDDRLTGLISTTDLLGLLATRGWGARSPSSAEEELLELPRPS